MQHIGWMFRIKCRIYVLWIKPLNWLQTTKFFAWLKLIYGHLFLHTHTHKLVCRPNTKCTWIYAVTDSHNKIINHPPNVWSPREEKAWKHISPIAVSNQYFTNTYNQISSNLQLCFSHLLVIIIRLAQCVHQYVKDIVVVMILTHSHTQTRAHTQTQAHWSP